MNARELAAVSRLVRKDAFRTFTEFLITPVRLSSGRNDPRGEGPADITIWDRCLPAGADEAYTTVDVVVGDPDE